MQTAISNPYHMQPAIKERTPIKLQPVAKRVHCLRCGWISFVVTIRSRFLGRRRSKDGAWEAKSIDICGHCRNVIQPPVEKAEEAS